MHMQDLLCGLGGDELETLIRIISVHIPENQHMGGQLYEILCIINIINLYIGH